MAEVLSLEMAKFLGVEGLLRQTTWEHLWQHSRKKKVSNKASGDHNYWKQSERMGPIGLNSNLASQSTNIPLRRRESQTRFSMKSILGLGYTSLNEVQTSLQSISIAGNL